jgi:two-component system, response regulator PdtaR
VLRDNASAAAAPCLKLQDRALYAPADSEAGGAIRPARILVVEDDYFVALQLEHDLQEAGFVVVGIARSAEESLAMATAEKPELAIMDIRLAGRRDGVDAAIELLAHLGVRSIFATAHSDQETRRRAERANPLGWLQKPYPSKALVALVNESLGAKNQPEGG